MRGDNASALQEPFDAGRHLAAARRRADLSQREMAALGGLSQSLLASVESGSRRIQTDLLQTLLNIAGLRLAVVDATGTEVAAVDPDAVRDNGGRRFPAHLDVRPPDDPPSARSASPRYDRQPAKGWYQLRPERDRDRQDRQDRHLHAVPARHPTTAEVEYRRLLRLYGRFAWWALREPDIARSLGLEPGGNLPG
jgi:transcriptional regulator with XRE-family HTH domain